MVTGSLGAKGRGDFYTWDRKAHAEVSLGAVLPEAF